MITIAKCPACNAKIPVNDTKVAGVCEYCGSTYSVEKPEEPEIQPTEYVGQSMSLFQPQAIRYTEQTIQYAGQGISSIPSLQPSPPPAVRIQTTGRVPRRPRFSIITCFFLTMIFPPCIIIYPFIKLQSQREWDAKYRYKR